MISSQMVLTMDQILQWRREYFARQRSGLTFTDVDYVVASFLINQLNLQRLHADNPDVQTLFAEIAQRQERQITIYGADDPAPARVGEATDALSDLYLIGTNSVVNPEFIAGASAHGAITLFYDLNQPAGMELAEGLHKLLGEDGLLIPLMGLAPGLWRAASCLIIRRPHRAMVMEIVRQLITVFSCDEMDALRLLEDNLQLRALVQKLNVPASGHGDIERLKQTITTLETELMFLRRAAVMQEQTIGNTSC